MKKKSVIAWLAVLALIAVAIIVAIVFPVGRWIEAVISFVRGLGWAGILVYALLYIGGTVLMVPGTALTAGAGLLYGTLVGVLIVSPASVLGATLSFLIGRYVARGWVESRLRNYPSFTALDHAIQEDGFKVVLLMRLQPVFIPFTLLNYALGLTSVRLKDYIIASWIGMLPATVVYVYFGALAGDIHHLLHGDFLSGNSHRWLIWTGFAAAVTFVWIITRMARRALHRNIRIPESQERTA